MYISLTLATMAPAGLHLIYGAFGCGKRDRAGEFCPGLRPKYLDKVDLNHPRFIGAIAPPFPAAGIVEANCEIIHNVDRGQPDSICLL